MREEIHHAITDAGENVRGEVKFSFSSQVCLLACLSETAKKNSAVAG